MLCLGAKVQTTVQGGSRPTRFTTTTIIIIIIILIFFGNVFMFYEFRAGFRPAALGHTLSPPSSAPSRDRPHHCPSPLLCS